MEKTLKIMKSRSIAIVLITLALGILFLPFTASAVVDWTKDDANNPVLERGSSPAWDDEEIERPCVIKDGSTFKMWYTGFDGTTRAVGYAYSSNETGWSKYGSNPVFQPGAADCPFKVFAYPGNPLSYQWFLNIRSISFLIRSSQCEFSERTYRT